MHVVFRVDGSPTIGLGHVARCRTLAAELRVAGATTELAYCELPEAVAEACRHEGMAVVKLPGTRGSREEGGALERRLRDARADVAVLDGYVFDTSYVARLRALGVGTVVIDDAAGGRYECDVLVNSNVYAPCGRFELSPGGQALLGPTYALLRPEFSSARSSRRPAHPSPRSVLVTLGGADPVNFTGKLFQAARTTSLGAMDIAAVMGPAASGLYPERLELAAGGVWRTLWGLSPSRMADVMSASSFAVTAGGTTCLELCCIGVPAVVVAVADNQRPVVTALDAAGLMVGLGWHEDVTPQRVAEVLLELADRQDVAMHMRKAQHDAVDGGGARRVADAVVALTARSRPPGSRPA